jgi:ABC-type dipeptide/oligopeptide/nickel transport system permease component
VGPDASVDQAAVQRLRHDLLLDRPLPVQYADWLRHACGGVVCRSAAVKSPDVWASGKAATNDDGRRW